MMAVAVVLMVGPTIGGALTQSFGWRAVLVLMLACGIVALVVVYLDLGETRSNAGGGGKGGYFRFLGFRLFWYYTMAATFSSQVFFAFLGGGPFVVIDAWQFRPPRTVPISASRRSDT